MLLPLAVFGHEKARRARGASGLQELQLLSAQDGELRSQSPPCRHRAHSHLRIIDPRDGCDRSSAGPRRALVTSTAARGSAPGSGGEGPPLLLIHGYGGAAWNFSELAPLLPGRRLLIPDLPGPRRLDRRCRPRRRSRATRTRSPRTLDRPRGRVRALARRRGRAAARRAPSRARPQHRARRGSRDLELDPQRRGHDHACRDRAAGPDRRAAAAERIAGSLRLAAARLRRRSRSRTPIC